MLGLSAPNSPGRTCARYGRSRIPGSSICYLFAKPERGQKTTRFPQLPLLATIFVRIYMRLSLSGKSRWNAFNHTNLLNVRLVVMVLLHTQCPGTQENWLTVLMRCRAHVGLRIHGTRVAPVSLPRGNSGQGTRARLLHHFMDVTRDLPHAGRWRPMRARCSHITVTTCHPLAGGTRFVSAARTYPSRPATRR